MYGPTIESRLKILAIINATDCAEDESAVAIKPDINPPINDGIKDNTKLYIQYVLALNL